MKVAFRIFSYVRPYWRRVVVLYVALFAALGIQLAIPLLRSHRAPLITMTTGARTLC